ncbi:MAG: penicillin-binding protein 2 [Frankiaceae bacterium]|nr:penicillin-binding protein 2 [Frankiaceae bacterium]
MNRPLRRVALACMVLFGLLLLNVNWVQVVKAEAYRDDPRNSRVLLRTYERERGPIAVLGQDGRRQAVAESTRTDGPLTWLRQYPGGASYAHVTGYYSLVYGRTGIERAEDDVLSGEADELFVRRLSDYVTGREPQGASVLLTLDPRAQAAAFEGLQGQRGAVVALDPRTGAVLAMVSLPSFEPARLSSFEPADIREYYAALNDATDDPLLNRAISKTYPPGSTFKVVTAAAALESGQVTPETQIPSPVLLDLPQTDSDLRNFGGSACSGETSTLAEALRISCNTAFGALGLQLGDDVLREQAEAFGFGDNDLRVPTSVADSRFPDDANAPQTAQSAIGQFDVRVTPLQMAMVAAGIANGGEVMEPYLVREVQSPDLSVLRTADTNLLNRAVSGDVAAELTRMMELVVAEGSGRRAQIDGVRVAGKTGTAQHAPGRPPHAWFIGFAPADDPQVAVAVVVEDGGNLGSEATGGALSAPVAAAVMRAVLGR